MSNFRSGMSAAALLLLASGPASACACGCGVFDIGNLVRATPGGSVFAEYDWMDQNRNWHGTSRAPAADNDDKDIRSDLLTFGGQYLLESGWGVTLDVPVWTRHLETTESGSLESHDRTALGDIRLTAVYAGLSDDLGTGITLGVKLPSGPTSGFDRDTAIGSGSTDAIFGAFRQGPLDALATWRYALQVRYESAFASQGGYRPGDELNGVAALIYDAGTAGAFGFSPFLDLVGSLRRHDSGPAADPGNSGYSRLLLAPGIEVAYDAVSLHLQAEIPVYQNVIGNQLVAPVLLKTSIAYDF